MKRKIDPWFDPTATKVCKKCEEELPIRQFGRSNDSRQKKGYRIDSRCKPCKALQARERRANTKISERPDYEEHKARQRAASRALSRLRQRFPEVYRDFYLEEIEKEFPEGRPGQGRPGQK